MKKQKWIILDEEINNELWQHIIPDFDELPHGSIESKEGLELGTFDCPCLPKIDIANRLIIHSSFIHKRLINESINSNFK